MDTQANTLSPVDYTVFIVVLLGSTFIGMYHGWKTRYTFNDTERGGNPESNLRMSIIPVSLSVAASIISPNAVLAIPAQVFSHSIHYFAGEMFAVFGVIFIQQLLLPMFYELQLTSVNKYLLKRFNLPALRVASTAAFNILYTIVSSVFVYGPALAISSVTPLSLNTSIIAVGIVCTFYTAAGGFKGVIWTDVFQFFVIIIGMAMVAVQGTLSAGGWKSLWSIADKGHLLQWTNFHYDTVYAVPTIWECALGMFVVRASFNATTQICVQRHCSLPSLLHAKISMYLGLLLTTVFFALSVYCGIAIFANYYDCDPLVKKAISSADQIMPYYVVQNLGFIPGLSGLFIASVLSGSLSTVSSAINSMAVLTWDDVLKRCVKVSSWMEYILMKVIAMVYGLVITLLAFSAKRIGSVLEVVLLLGAGVTGPQLGIFLLGAVCPFVKGKSALVSFILGQIVSASFTIALFIVGRPPRRLPTSIDGCPAENFTLASVNITSLEPTIDSLQSHSEVMWIQNVSPFFLPFLAFSTTFITGILLAIATGGLSQMYRNTRYLSPVIRGVMETARKGTAVEIPLECKPLGEKNASLNEPQDDSGALFIFKRLKNTKVSFSRVAKVF